VQLGITLVAPLGEAPTITPPEEDPEITSLAALGVAPPALPGEASPGIVPGIIPAAFLYKMITLVIIAALREVGILFQFFAMIDFFFNFICSFKLT